MLLIPTRSVRLLVLLFLLSVYLDAQSLRDKAEALGVSIGAAARPSLFSERLYSMTLASEFNMVEPEDAMKWWVLA